MRNGREAVCNGLAPIQRNSCGFLAAFARARKRPGALPVGANSRPYLSAVEIAENVVLSLVPSPVITGMIATAIPVAMSPYSIAVAALSSLRNLFDQTHSELLRKRGPESARRNVSEAAP